MNEKEILIEALVFHLRQDLRSLDMEQLTSTHYVQVCDGDATNIVFEYMIEDRGIARTYIDFRNQVRKHEVFALDDLAVN